MIHDIKSTMTDLFHLQEYIEDPAKMLLAV